MTILLRTIAKDKLRHNQMASLLSLVASTGLLGDWVSPEFPDSQVLLKSKLKEK